MIKLFYYFIVFLVDNGAPQPLSAHAWQVCSGKMVSVAPLSVKDREEPEKDRVVRYVETVQYVWRVRRVQTVQIVLSNVWAVPTPRQE